MDWVVGAIERHATALRRVVAGFVAMVGASAGPAADAADLAADRPTLARHRHRALLRLVRPAEAAARRLVIALALATQAPGAASADAQAPAAPAGAAARQDAGPDGAATREDDSAEIRPAGGRDAAPGDGHHAPAAVSRTAEAAAQPADRRAGGPAAPAAPLTPAAPAATRLLRRRRRVRPHEPKPGSVFVKDGVGTGIVLAPGMAIPDWAAGDPVLPRILRLPLTDPVRRQRVRRVATRDLPRLMRPPRPDPSRRPAWSAPQPDDRLDATRLVLRIRALAAALDDMGGEVARFRRWQARHARRIAEDRAAQAAAQARAVAEAAHAARLATVGARPLTLVLGIAGVPPAAAAPPPRVRRASPLRNGRPPGSRRRRVHEVDAILAEAHFCALRMLRPPDTS